MKLWLRHPLRMFHLAQGYCPVCNSSPPAPNCPVCQGTYNYGPKITPGTQSAWLILFRIWLKH